MIDTASDLSADSPELNGYPPSRYYAGMFYIGRFVEAGRVPELRETRAETPIVFQTYEQQAEPELPEILWTAIRATRSIGECGLIAAIFRTAEQRTALAQDSAPIRNW